MASMLASTSFALVTVTATTGPEVLLKTAIISFSEILRRHSTRLSPRVSDVPLHRRGPIVAVAHADDTHDGG